LFWKKSKTKASQNYIDHKLVTVDQDYYDCLIDIRNMLFDLAYFQWELVSVIETPQTKSFMKDDGGWETVKFNERHYYFKRTTEPPEHPYYGHDHYTSLVQYFEECEHRADVKAALNREKKT
jgi:hypothetical protein